MRKCSFFDTLVLGCVAICYSCSISKAAESAEKADTIIYNARVITVSSSFASARAVAVQGDKILAVGGDGEVERHKGPNTRMIDAKGQTVMPGLYDNDVHSFEASISELHGPLPTLDSIAAAQEYIRKQASQKPPGTWIILERLYPTRLKEGRLPTKAELDEAAPHHAVYWNCGSLAMVNSKALELSRVTRETSNPVGGEIVKDPKTLKPTGLLRNASGVLKLPVTRTPTRDQQREALKQLHHLYNEQGITSIGERGAGPEAINLFRELSKAGELTVRVNCVRRIEPGATIEEAFARLDAITNAGRGRPPCGPTGAGDDWVRMGPLEVDLDGGIGDGTAYLRTPWGIGPAYQITEPAYRGQINVDNEFFPAFYAEAAKRGWQLSAQCTGDAAMDLLLNIYEKIQFQRDIRQRRFLITRADFQTAQNWERCQKLGIAAEIQPACLYEDGHNLAKMLGEKRLKYFLPFKSWFDHGLTIGGGSEHLAKLDSLDAVNPWNPWLGIWITLTRHTLQGPALSPEEKLTREQAIRFYTVNNAYLNFEEKKKGSLEPGKFADLVMIDTDILRCPVDEIRNTKALLTMVGGKIVWEAKK